MQIISVNLTNDFGGNQLKYHNDLPAFGNKNYVLQKLLKINFLNIIKHY